MVTATLKQFVFYYWAIGRMLSFLYISDYIPKTYVSFEGHNETMVLQ